MDLLASEASELDNLKARFGLRSRTDAIRIALAITEWVHSETESGKQILAINEHSLSHLAVPELTSRQ